MNKAAEFAVAAVVVEQFHSDVTGFVAGGFDAEPIDDQCLAIGRKVTLQGPVDFDRHGCSVGGYIDQREMHSSGLVGIDLWILNGITFDIEQSIAGGQVDGDRFRATLEDSDSVNGFEHNGVGGGFDGEGDRRG